MFGFVVSAIVGIICIVIGISNTKGNISMIHSYHRQRVSEKDILPFGKLVGLGTIIIGVSIVLCSILSVVTLLNENQVFLYIGMGILFVGIVAGICISFFAMFKYNKGIF